VVQLLLDAGSAVDAEDAYGWTALRLATANGHDEVVELLLGAGADPQSSLAVAVQQGHHEIAQLLRDAGAVD
jgi:ankyrin repeat protein